MPPNCTLKWLQILCHESFSAVIKKVKDVNNGQIVSEGTSMKTPSNERDQGLTLPLSKVFFLKLL